MVAQSHLEQLDAAQPLSAKIDAAIALQRKMMAIKEQHPELEASKSHVCYKMVKEFEPTSEKVFQHYQRSCLECCTKAVVDAELALENLMKPRAERLATFEGSSWEEILKQAGPTLSAWDAPEFERAIADLQKA